MGSTQPLVKMSTKTVPGVKGSRCVRVTNVMKVWEPKPPGTLWATPGLLRDCFTFTFTHAVRFEALTTMLVKIQVFWNVTLRGPVNSCALKMGAIVVPSFSCCRFADPSLHDIRDHLIAP
jgi:hypothetical protein